MSEKSQAPQSGAESAHAPDAAALSPGLTYAGKRDEAAQHFARAARFDLMPSEHAELRRFSARQH